MAAPVAMAQASESARGAIEEVVVTAQRREQRLQDVPLTLTALSDKQLIQSGVTNMFDLQNVVPGLTFGGVGNLSQPAIRGLSTGVSTNGSENPNALYVDDVYYSQGNLLGANLPDVSRVEVLKGPQGTLFGRNSVGGAIRVFTKDPTYEPSADVTLETGYYTGDGDSRSSPHYATRAFASTGVVDDLMAVSVSGGYDTTDGFLTNVANGEEYGTITRSNARVKLLVEPSDAVKAVISAFYLKHNDEGLQSQTPVDGLVVSSQHPNSIVPDKAWHTGYDTGLGNDFNDATVKSSGGSANIRFNMEGLGSLTSITAYHDTEVYNETALPHSVSDPSCIATFACIDYTYLATNKAVSQEFNFASEQFGILTYTAGLFYYHQKSSTDTAVQETLIPGGSPVKNTRFDITSYAAYGEVQIDPTDDLTVIIGGRYTYEPHEDSIVFPVQIERDETFTSFVPRLTVQYDLTPDMNVYASYSEGEKSGLSGVDNGASNPPYQKVDPEENNAYELGMKYASADLVFNAALFYYDYKNKQEQGFTGSAVFVQNTGPVRIYGLDLDGSVQLIPELSLRAAASWVPEAEYRDFPDAAAYGTDRNANGTFQQFEYDATGERLIRAPEFTGNVSLLYERELESGGLDASTTLSYSSKVYHDIYHVIEQPEYYTLSAQAGYRFHGGLRIGLYGRNLTNEDYIAHGFSSAQGFTAAYARPREVGLSFNYSL
ncbi:TonB-dependent receptor [Pseudomaricurvus sp. HS19]|uniref:TonB-dependent receptor n=1 Tax=Pseudomaricurvus sp. HS19 TaxID=2692626 RepID=UPI001368128C|nr:TonB-dependent receptor [Pseudomaricurvus sp. HS19]MYM62433.1 TonB-dependent receptor [Pseudomaricurvus sp. HS19]